MMKKYFLAVPILTMMLFSIAGIIATTGLSQTGDGIAEWSSLNTGPSFESIRLFAPKIISFPPSNEGRIRIEFPNGMTLAELQNISWTQFVAQGYLAHVDVLLDIDGNGVYNNTIDDVLVFEYAKVDNSSCDVTPYPNGSMDTFGSNGIVSDAAYGWLNSGDAGPCGGATFYSHPLSAWKSVSGVTIGTKTIKGATKIIALEIEVDGWIAKSEAFISNVKINGESVERLCNNCTKYSIRSDLKKGFDNNSIEKYYSNLSDIKTAKGKFSANLNRQGGDVGGGELIAKIVYNNKKSEQFSVAWKDKGRVMWKEKKVTKEGTYNFTVIDDTKEKTVIKANALVNRNGVRNFMEVKITLNKTNEKFTVESADGTSFKFSALIDDKAGFIKP